MPHNLDPLQATLLVINVVDAWLRQHQMGPFDDGMTIPDDPPQGYRFSDNSYQDFCKAIARTVSAAAGRKLALDDGFRSAHFHGTMGAFASDVATKLLEAPPGASALQLATLAKKLTR